MRSRVQTLLRSPAVVRHGAARAKDASSTMSAMAHLESAHPASRCILLSGPAGSGKTTVCRLGHRAMLATWSHPAAAIDVDQLYLNVDAHWELPYDNLRNTMVLSQATQLASSFVRAWLANHHDLRKQPP